MKKTIYTLAAVFSVSVAVMFILGFIFNLKEEFALPSGGWMWDLIIFDAFQIFSVLALFILSLVQLRISTPRLILLFSGYAFFKSVLIVLQGYLYGFILMAAGLLPAIYELTRCGLAAKQEPRRQEKMRWFLVIAFAPFCVLAALIIYTTMQSVNDLTGGQPAIAASAICAAIFCGLMNRRTSVLYRMFFTGYFAVDVLANLLVYFYNIFLSSDKSDYMSSVLTGLIPIIIYLAAVLLILIQAAKSRHSDMLPQELATQSQQIGPQL